MYDENETTRIEQSIELTNKRKNNELEKHSI